MTGTCYSDQMNHAPLLGKEVITDGEPNIPVLYLLIQSQLMLIAGSWEWPVFSERVFCSDVIGLPPQRFEGTTGIIHPDDIEGLKKALEWPDFNGPKDISFRMITSYGEVRLLMGENCCKVENNSPYALYPAGGAVNAKQPENEFVKKKEDEKELKRGCDAFYQLREIIRISERLGNSGSWYIKADTGETWYSDNIFRIHGILPQSLNSHPNTFTSFIHGDEKIIVSEAFDKGYRERVPVHLDFRIITPDGNEKFISQTTHWVHSYTGGEILIGLVRDETAWLNTCQKAENDQNQLKFFEQLLQLNEKHGQTGYWYMNMYTRQTYFSDNYYRIHGLKPQSIPASANTFANYVHPDDREKVLEADTRITNEHVVPEMEYRIIRPDRKLRFVKRTGKLFTYGNELVIAGVIYDVSQQKKYDVRLHQLTSELQLLQEIQNQTDEMAGVSSMLWDADEGGMVRCSDSGCKLFGIKKNIKELTQKELLHIVLPEDRSMFKDNLSAVLEGSEERDIVFRILRVGEVRTLKARFRLIFYEKKKYFAATFQDISEAHVMQQQVHEGLQLNRLLAGNIIDIVFITDVYNNIILWNRTCERMYRLKKEEVTGRNYFDVFPHYRDEETIKRFNRVLKGDFVYEQNQNVFAKEYFNVHMLPLKSDDGVVSGILHILHEVTREMQLHNALNERLHFIERLLDETVDRIMVLDKNYTYTYWNRKAELDYYINKEYTVGKNVLEVFPSLVNHLFYTELKKTFMGETVHLPPAPDVVNKDLVSEIYLVPLLNERREVNSVLWIARDLTREYLAKIEEGKKDLQYKTLVEATPDVITRWNSRMELVFANSAFEKRTHIANERNYGKNSIEMNQPAEIALPWMASLRKVFETGEEVTHYNFLPSPGSGSHFYSRIVPEKDAGGNVVTVLAIARDITELRKAENDVKESKDLLHHQNRIYEYAEATARIGTWVWYPHTNKAHYSDNLFRLFGLVPQSVEPGFDTIIKYIHPDDREKLFKAAAELKEGKEHIAVIYRVNRMDGIQRVFKNMARIIAGDETCVIGTTQDITEIQEQNLSRENANILLQQKRRFASMAAHELKQPITSLKAALELLTTMIESPSGKKPVEHLLQTSRKQVDKLTALIDDLLDVSVLDEGKMKIVKASFNLGEAVDEVVTEIVSADGDRKVTVESNSPVTVLADRIRIQQVLNNFIANAVKYSPEDKCIHIKICRFKNHVKILVCDRGPGIKKEATEHLFEKYFRANNTAGSARGFGLGLYISKEIIKEHGGDIGAKSREGKGSTFWFTLPV